MPLPFFLAALFGKVAGGALAKGLASKAATGAAKAVAHHHGHHALARDIVGKVGEQAVDSIAEAGKKRSKAKRERR
jgi:hypothetical protein